MSLATVIGFLALGAWLCLLFARGGFWRLRERDDAEAPAPARWPAVVAIVPARNEAEVIRRSVGSLLAQEYPGDFRVVVVDDQSEDGTGDAARGLPSERLAVLTGIPRPAGWTGKLWAMEQGLRFVQERTNAGPAGAASPPEFVWFTDADIAHRPDTLAWLVSWAQGAEAGRERVLVSLMARLSCRTAAERLLIPAFVFFFAMLYPFGAVACPKRRTAAAAGGCMLVRAAALRRAGGLESIRVALIDDCALARLLKPKGPIWLGLTDRCVSLRPYGSFADIRGMVARSAYAQLRYSAALLGGTLAAMAVIFVAPPLLAAFSGGPARMAGLLAWAGMAVAFQPILAFYRRSPLWGIALPFIAACYGIFTLDSAVKCWSGKGGLWKGRVQKD